MSVAKGGDRTLLKNTIYLYIVTVIKIVAPLATLPYLTRVLSVDGYGTVSFVKAYCSYVQLLIDFGFLLSATKSIAEAFGDKHSIGRITGDTIVEKGILSVASLILTVVFCLLVPLLRENALFVFLYVFSCVSTIGILDFLYRGIEKMGYVAIPFALSKTITVALTFVCVRGDCDLLLIPILEIAGNMVAAIVSLLFLRREGIRLSFSGVKSWIADLADSFVYFASNFATTFFGALTTLMAGVFLTSADVAFWSVCMMAVSAAKSLYSPISNSLYPRMIVTKDLGLVNKVTMVLSVPLLLGCLAVLFFGDQIMLIVAGQKYAQSGLVLKSLVPVLLFSFYSMMYGWPVLGAIGKRNETTITTIIAAAFQMGGLLTLLVTGNFTLFSLSVCCGASEAILLVARLVVVLKNRSAFVCARS